MSLRGQFDDRHAAFAEPKRGINLRDAPEDLQGGEARLMVNHIIRGGTVKRPGSTRLVTSSLGAFTVRGGHKFYNEAGTGRRYIAYDTNISLINDSGGETITNSGMTTDLDTHFTTWSITDALYIANNTDTLRTINNAGTFSTVTGTNIPSPRMVLPFLDRLLAITNNGIERTDPRSATIWSSDSAWATFRGDEVGRFTAMAPFTYEVARDVDPVATSVIAFQPTAYYLITGSDLGSDVTAATAPSGENAAILRLNPSVGTSSPYSVVTVPGLGLFWFTSDANVYWLPPNATIGRNIGDKLRSTGTTPGIENINTARLDQVTMKYFDGFLILAYPDGTSVFPNRQFWMDIRSMVDVPQRGPVWYGPMQGPTIGRIWIENQGSDNRLMAGEANATTGAFVYDMWQTSTFTDAIGTSDTAIAIAYLTHYKTFGKAGWTKYCRSVEANLGVASGAVLLDVLDLHRAVATDITMTQESGTTVGQSYGSTITYSTIREYGESNILAGHFYQAIVDNHNVHYLAVRLRHSTNSEFRIFNILPIIKYRHRAQPAG